MIFGNFFAKSGTVTPYKMYSPTHFAIIFICVLVISLAVWLFRKAKESDVTKITRICCVALWILEIMKIVFNLAAGNARYPNSYVPLYFCSIPLYCSIMSGWGRGRVKRAGDVFMVVGGMVGGIAYILSPNTTAGIYQAFHFITVQSYILHCIMVFLSILYLITRYCRLKVSDIKYYAGVVVIMCVTAFCVNLMLDSNLMFVSKNFPGTPMEPIYNFSPTLFPLIMTLIQSVPPFIVVYALVSVTEKILIKQKYVE